MLFYFLTYPRLTAPPLSRCLRALFVNATTLEHFYQLNTRVVLEGMEVVKWIGKVKTGANDKPVVDVIISQCGAKQIEQ
jgi:hypothetical protein